MPNWCENTLRITGPPTTLATFKEMAKGYPVKYKEVHAPLFPVEEPKESQLSFNSLVPVPTELLERTYGGEYEAREKMDLPLVDECAHGYDWQRKHWGTKWDADVYEVNDSVDELEYKFDTAWGPPIEFVAKAANLFPMLHFELSYNEPGMGLSGLETFNNPETWQKDT